MPLEVLLRPATPDDAAACAAIYAPYVEGTTISFEETPPDAAEIGRRMRLFTEHFDWLVAEREGAVLGYAYAHAFAERAAYRWSCETTIYLDGSARGLGLGRLLYTELLQRTATRGYHQAFAGVTQPNDASAGLHRSLGFTEAGLYRRVGFKHGAWLDVRWYQRTLVPLDGTPPEPS